MKTNRKFVFVAIAFMLATGLVLNGCALGAAKISDITRSLRGVSATVETYDQYGNLIDRIHGLSIQVGRNSDFDSVGSSTNGPIHIPDSEVLRLNIGNNILYHVGSTMIIYQDGLAPIVGGPGTVQANSIEPGKPWLNSMYERYRNAWGGRAKTIMARSQNGTPIEVFAGNKVEIYASDVPKSTRFQVDGKFLWIYRADYSVPDTALLAS